MTVTRRPRLIRLSVGVAVLVVTVAQFTVVGAQVVRDVVLVSNELGGTVSVIDANTFQVLRTIDVVPDGAAPDPEEDPVQAALYPVLIEALGVNLAQDLDVSPDGRVLYVSRGHRGDVAAFDMATGERVWRTEIGGLRADHMTLSPDGSRLYVSAISENEVEVLDAGTGTVLGSFPTGDFSHDNVYLDTPAGPRIFNGSLGNVLTPEEIRNDRPQSVDDVLDQVQELDGPLAEAGLNVVNEPYQLTIADADTLEVLDEIEFPRGIRPFLITSDQTIMYAQLSQFHGIIEYSLAERRFLRTTQLPIDEGVTEDDYDFEAPHHGLALSPDETLLCAAGRASDYVALVSTATFEPVAIIDVADAPGWAANSPDGSHCFVANNRADKVSVISYATKALVATIDVGNGPKHVLGARVPEDVLGL